MVTLVPSDFHRCCAWSTWSPMFILSPFIFFNMCFGPVLSLFILTSSFYICFGLVPSFVHTYPFIVLHLLRPSTHIVHSDLFIVLHVRQPSATIVHSDPFISSVLPVYSDLFIVLHVRRPSATIVHSDHFISSVLPSFVLTSFIVLHVRTPATCLHCSQP